MAHQKLSYKNVSNCLENKRKIEPYENNTILSVDLLLHFSVLTGKEHWLF